MDFNTEDYRENESKREYMNRMIGSNLNDLQQESFGTNIDIDIDSQKVAKLISFGYPEEYII